MILFARTESCAKYSEDQLRLFFFFWTLYCPERLLSVFRTSLANPDIPEKFRRVGNPKCHLSLVDHFRYVCY